MDKRRVNQQTIADMLDISRSTVTKVLNHDPVYRVSPETRELILKTARELGFNLRRRRTGNIGFVVCGEIHTAIQEMHQAVCNEADKLGYRVFLVSKPPLPSYREISLSVNPLVADGVILLGQIQSDVAVQLGDVLPTIMMYSDLPMEGVDSVTADYFLLAQRLIRKSLDCGHQRVAVIVDTEEDSHFEINGCRSAHESVGLPFDRSLVWQKRGCLYPKLIAEIIDHPAGPSALVAFTTSDHPLILSTLYALGRRVPEDMSYVGWATSHFSSLAAFPEVTCLESFHQRMAETALGRLLERIEDRSLPAENIVVDVGVREGQTCIPYSKNHYS